MSIRDRFITFTCPCWSTNLTTVDESADAFRRYYDLLRTIGLSTTEDVIPPTCTWLVCRIGVPEPAERYFLKGFQRWHIKWVEVVSELV